jgi:prolyl-tRNA synthetase
LRLATSDEIESFFGCKPGFLGPVGLPHGWRDKAPLVILDAALDGRRELVAGANKEGYHLRNVTPARDIKPTLSADIRSVNEGEACPQEGCAGRLAVGKAVEIGHIFKLGYKYSESMGARVLDENGKEVTPIMGSYGIGIERILTASIEQANDKNGFWLPAAIAPFTVVVTVTNASDAALAEVGEKLAAELEAAGLDVLLDDRDERAGVKFKDADLVGIPYRVNVGRKAAGGFIELQTRATATSVDVAIHDVVASVKARVEEDALLTAVEA